MPEAHPHAEDDDGPSREEQQSKPIVNLIAIIIFFHIFSFTISDDDRSKAAFFLGVVTAMIALISFFTNPFYGHLSDKFGRRLFLLIGMCGYIGAMLVMAIFLSKAGFIIAGIISGSTSAVSVMASAVIVDVSSSTQVFSRNFGLIAAAVGAGFICGAGTGAGVATSSSMRLPFFVAAATDLIPIMLVLCKLPETGHFSKEIMLQSGQVVQKSELLLHSMNPLTTLPVISTTPRLLRISLGYFFFQIAVGVVSVFLVYIEERYDWTGSQVGLFLAYFGLVAIVAQVTVLRWAATHWTPDKTMRVGVSWVCLMLFLFGLAWEGWMWYLITLVCIVGLITPAVLNAEASKEVTETDQGRLQGALTALSTIGSVIGSLICSGLLSLFLSDHGGIYFPGAPFFFSCLVGFVSLYTVTKAGDYPVSTVMDDNIKHHHLQEEQEMMAAEEHHSSEDPPEEEEEEEEENTNNDNHHQQHQVMDVDAPLKAGNE